MPNKCFQRLLLVFISSKAYMFAENTYSESVYTERKVICYDEIGIPIDGNGNDSLARCVYKKDYLRIFAKLKIDPAHNVDHSVDCRIEDICYAACSKYTCLSVSLVSDLLLYKSVWTIRYACFSCLFSGCSISFVILMYLSNRQRINTIVNMNRIDGSSQDSKSVSESGKTEFESENDKVQDGDEGLPDMNCNLILKTNSYDS